MWTSGIIGPVHGPAKLEKRWQNLLGRLTRQASQIFFSQTEGCNNNSPSMHEAMSWHARKSSKTSTSRFEYFSF